MKEKGTERIKDVSKVIMYDGNILIQIHRDKKSDLILPEGADSSQMADYATVVSVTESIKDLKKGDIVLDFNTTQAFEWDEFIFAIVPRHAIKLAVDAANFKTK